MIASETSGNGFRGVAEYVTFEKNTVASNESFFQLAQPIDGTNGRPFALHRTSDHHHQSRFAGLGARATPKPADSLSSLSRRRLVPLKDQPQLFLSGDARSNLELRHTDAVDGLRRPGAGQAGAGGTRLGDRGVRGEYIGGTLIGAPREMARQAAPFRSARADAKAPVMHYSLALEAGDGRKTKEEWAVMVERFLDKMGFDRKRGAWASWIHRDTDMDHAHIVFMRSMGDGSLWNREFSARRAIQATAEIEREFGLLTHDRTPKKEKHRLTRKEAELASKLARKGQKMTKVEMQKHIDSVVSQLSKDHPDGYDVDQLSSALSGVGVQVEAYEPKGKLTGLKYQMDGVWVSGSSMGTDYSPKGLMARGLLAARRVRSDALAPAQAKQVVSTKEALGDLLDGLDASFLARLAKDAKVIENEHRVAVMKKQKGLVALLADLPRVAQAAVGSFINMLMKLIEKVFFLPEGALGRVEVPEVDRTEDVPVGVVPPAPMRADADLSEVKRHAVALKVADGVLDKAIKAVEQRKPELLPSPQSADEGIQASRFAAVQGLKVGDLETEAPAAARAIEARADTPEQAKARELLRRSHIFLLKDKITYLTHEGDEESAYQLDEDLINELGFDGTDEQAYQEWTRSADAKLLEDESSEHYMLRREVEHLGYQLQLDHEFKLGMSDCERERTEEALARIQIELLKVELHQERESQR